MFEAIEANSTRGRPAEIAARDPEIFASERGNSTAVLQLFGPDVGAVNSINPIVTHSLRQMTRAITRNGALRRRAQRALFHFNKRGTVSGPFGEKMREERIGG